MTFLCRKSGPYEASPDEEPRVPPKVIASADDEFDGELLLEFLCIESSKFSLGTMFS